MKIFLSILAVIALLVLLGGALNHETEVSLDYLVGSTPGVSIVWFALGVGAGLLIAGLAGWSVGRAGAGDARAKLERELESTYRRLRECEAKLPAAAAPVVDVTAAAPAQADEAVTAVAPTAAPEADTIVAPTATDEAVTAVAPTAADDAETIVAPTAAPEAVTAVSPPPDAETGTAVTPAPAAPGEAGAEDSSAS